MANGNPTRAITLGGGGPAAGLHIGVLEALASADINFNVWSLSCIGAWVGIVYNQSTKNTARGKVEETYEFFRNGVFRDDEDYKRFPINTVFGPDWRSNIDAFNKFVGDPKNYRDFQFQPYRIFEFIQDSLSIVMNQLPAGDKPFKTLDEGDLNRWILNQVMAPNPFIRYMTSLMYLSKFNGLSRINYPDSEFMQKIRFDRLPEVKPFIFHNAWDLDHHELAFFANRPMTMPNADDDGSIKKRYEGPITAQSLCACSALPFIEETVEIDGTTYCEGALVDTVNFEGLVDLRVEGRKLDEIWISRIVDSRQVRKPENLHDALANLCQLFAASVGEDDVKLFKYHVRYDRQTRTVSKSNGTKNQNSKKAEHAKAEDSRGHNSNGEWNGTVVEIHVPGHINFKWNHSNLDNGRKLGREAAEQAIKQYRKHKDTPHQDAPLFINEKPEEDAEWRRVRDDYRHLQKVLAESDRADHPS
ncbi:patatin-like phospholipase family protein [Bradyrhizobium sp.]|uniref:patatin-like phospholipase family protein n=1 Tax=Bradyrhizobium sp. TaxID=376 RepID=UPI00239D9012|nr:patatin-like phospholipase family protein [Bradyrhizobium sp.]MDE1936729.1 patatin-like phospholipase family protein [Bradyrhizobium sp.]